MNIDGESLLSLFPPVEFAFAYGSGVITQSGYKYSESNAEHDFRSSSQQSKGQQENIKNMPSMIDVIFVVNNPSEWHTLNRIKNSAHYTTLWPMDSFTISHVQEKYGAGMWFHAYIQVNIPQFEGRFLKYGAISTDHFLQDLNDWKYIYSAGRLHKPVQILKSNQEMMDALKINLQYALIASLLILPKRFSEIELFETVASLSYRGDPRMFVGENPKKIVNLVRPVLPEYKRIYKTGIAKISENFPLLHFNCSSSDKEPAIYSQDVTPDARWILCLQLPSTVKTMLSINVNRRTPPMAASIRSALAIIVAKSASIQSLKGLLSVGLVKTTGYIVQKLSKQWVAAH